MNRVDTFIANIYRSVEFRGTSDFRTAALRSLGVLVPFDGALWGSGNYDSREFHSVVTLGMRNDYPRVLEQTQGINPFWTALLDNLGTTINMDDIIPDAQFYHSEIYTRCFQHFGVERVQSYLDLDARTNIYTLLSLYRFDRGAQFNAWERASFERAAYHMIHAAQNAFFVHLARQGGADSDVAAAICDSHGLFYEAQPEFLDLVEQHSPGWPGEALPFAIPPTGERVFENGLCIEAEPFGDLFCIRLWEQRPTDTLSVRDRDIVNGVCQGMTFKEIARELNLAPSTISNRLYRLYRKLGVTSRASLARLVRGE